MREEYFLSPHFRVREFTKSAVADRYGIVNEPDEEFILANLRALCGQVLEPLRAALHRPIVITSGYRSLRLNKRVGGADDSQHRLGEAADFIVRGMLIPDVFAVASLVELPFDQWIFETLVEESGRRRSWFHMSHRRHGLNRKEKLTVVKKGEKSYVYEGHFVPEI